MAFSAKRQSPKASSTARRSAVGVPGSPQLIAPKSPSKLTKKLTMAPGGPEYDSPGDYRPAPASPYASMQQSSPGPQEQRVVPHRDAPPTWRYAQRRDSEMTSATGDRRGSTVGCTTGGKDSVGLRRIRTSRPSDFNFDFNFMGDREAVSPRESIFSTVERRRSSFKAPAPAPAPYKPQQNSPGMESLSTATGGGAWSPGRYGRLRRQTEGGGTQILEPGDLPLAWIQQHENTMKGTRGERGDPQAWRHSGDIRKWEKRMHGDARTMDHDAKNQDLHLERQALDQCLSDSFRAPASVRARSCEALVSHPAQRTMRTAFTDRALKQAHTQGQVSLWSPKERDPEVVGASVVPADMPPAGTGRVKECLSVAMHNMDGATTPKGDAGQYPKNSNSQGMRKLITDSPSEGHSDLRESENIFRNELGVRRRGDMSPMAASGMRARSVDSAAGICRKLSAPASIFGGGYDAPLRSDGAHNAEGGDWTSRKTAYAAQEYNHLLGTGVSRCLSPRDSDTRVEPTAPLLYCRGGAPATERFSRTKHPMPPGPDNRGRPDFWFDTGCAYDTGRRMGRGEQRAYSAESRRHSIRRDLESESVYKFELIATGEGKPRAISQPPEYNPVLHTGTPREASRAPSRKKGGDASFRSSSSTGRLLNFEAGREEDQALSTARMANDKAFSEICSAISQRSEVRSQEAAQTFTRSHHQTRSSNMALLLRWE